MKEAPGLIGFVPLLLWSWTAGTQELKYMFQNFPYQEFQPLPLCFEGKNNPIWHREKRNLLGRELRSPQMRTGTYERATIRSRPSIRVPICSGNRFLNELVYLSYKTLRRGYNMKTKKYLPQFYIHKLWVGRHMNICLRIPILTDKMSMTDRWIIMLQDHDGMTYHTNSTN